MRRDREYIAALEQLLEHAINTGRNHQGHWDSTGGAGDGCPLCGRLGEMRADFEHLKAEQERDFISEWEAEDAIL